MADLNIGPLHICKLEKETKNTPSYDLKHLVTTYAYHYGLTPKQAVYMMRQELAEIRTTSSTDWLTE